MPEQIQKQPIRFTKTPTAFIPQRLTVPDKPEYFPFPENVLFVSHRSSGGRLESGSALYQPDFETYEAGTHGSSMTYRNVYGDNWYLVIEYNERGKRYRGQKFVNGQSVGEACGGDDWQSFFTHFTLLGLSNGEKCKFDYLSV
ncbi:MAG TPA: hypothetical protein VMH20_10790 [Verrucomicrobiae bacterium]|nr:hypothetical protein [Verrucomicrobiae bacterium]